MDDGVHHRVEGEVQLRRELLEALGVGEEHVQELVAEHRLDLRVGLAVAGHEVEVHEQPRPRLASDGEGGHLVGELDRGDLQDGPDREGVLVHDLLEDGLQILGRHA